DVATLRTLTFANPAPLAEILCAADAAIAEDAGENVADVLRKGGFLLDEHATLPESGIILSSLLQTALAADAIPKAAARTKWGTTLSEKAKTSKDPDLVNVA